MSGGKYKYRGFVISNMGYYQPDHHVWWEGVDEKTGEASYHGRTLREVMQMIDEDILREELTSKADCRGNAAKMREALDKIGNILLYMKECSGSEQTARYATESLDIMHAAIASPPRNCDVGTAEEQTKRLRKQCEKFKPSCKGCPCYGDIHKENCWLKWAQMPFVEEEPGNADE